MAQLLHTDGSHTLVSPTGQFFTLPELYALIGNGCDMIEVVYLRHGTMLVIDEEGKYREPLAPRNEQATNLLQEAGGLPGDFIQGNALLVTAEEFD